MDEDVINLYLYVYRMEKDRKQFVSESVRDACMKRVVQAYIDEHDIGNVFGFLDFNRSMIDLKTGDISHDFNCRLDGNQNAVTIENLKYAPPEYLNSGGAWTQNSDNHCLAVLLYVIRYAGFPFDGKLMYKKPIVNVNQARRFYSDPVFVFDSRRRENELNTMCDARIMAAWKQDEKSHLGNLFRSVFEDGIKNPAARCTPQEWMDALNGR